MFDFPSYDSGAADNSEMNINKKRDMIYPFSNSLVNCSSVMTGLSHEMRTHMNAIVAFSFLLKENCINSSDSDEYSKQILNSCEQLIEIFDSFFDNAIINEGNPANDPRICKLDNLLDDVVSEFREIIRKQKTYDLELISEKLFSEATKVFIDRNKILRVLRSLLQISIKSTNAGYIKLGYQYNEGKVTFYVLDSGQGYFKCKEFLHTEDLRESLLIHNDVPTAINITLAKKLIHILGGSIWIESNGLSGTGIYFSVPVREVLSQDITNNKYVNTMISI